MQVIVWMAWDVRLNQGNGVDRIDVSYDLLLAEFRLCIPHGALFAEEMTFCALEHVFLK